MMLNLNQYSVQNYHIWYALRVEIQWFCTKHYMEIKFNMESDYEFIWN